MELQTEKQYTIIFYIALFLILILSAIQNIHNPWIILTLSGVFLLSFTFRNASITAWKGDIKTLAVFELFIISIVFFYDSGMFTAVFFYILASNIVLTYNLVYSGIFTGSCFLVLVMLDYIKAGFPEFAGYFHVPMNRFYVFLAVYIMTRLIKLETIQKKQLRETVFRLKTTTKQSEDMVVKIKEATSKLEEMTAIQERNRIAREIHDTVGHTLTTVLVEIEAAQRLMKINDEEAGKKLTHAKEQVRKGLNSIRESVRMLKEGHEIKNLTQSITLLIQETIQRGNVFIQYEISPIPPMTPEMENILYRALMEGLTNGIRHGESTAFVFQLKTEPGKVLFFLQDNGKGTGDVIFGYGLNAMKEGVSELGGAFFVHSSPGEGFTIRIELLLEKEIQFNSQHGGCS